MAGRNAAYWQTKDFVAELKAKGKPVEITRFGVPKGFHDVDPHPVCNTLTHVAHGPHGSKNPRNTHAPPAESVHNTSEGVKTRPPCAPAVGRWAPSDFGYHYEFASSASRGHDPKLFTKT